MENNIISGLNQMKRSAMATAVNGAHTLNDSDAIANGNAIKTAVKALVPFSLSPSSPLQPGPTGINTRILIRSSQTNMQFCCAEIAVAPKTMGPAPHFHKELDEMMYVIEGTASVWVDGKLEDIPTGGWHIRPRNLEHTFWNGTDKPLRFIDMYFNQNFDEYLEEIFQKIVPDMVRDKATFAHPVYAKRMSDLHERFGMVSFPGKRQAFIEKYGLAG